MGQDKRSWEHYRSWTVLHAQCTSALSSGFLILQRKAEALDRWGGKTKHRPISYFLTNNTPAKNHRNRVAYVKIIAGQRWDFFETPCRTWKPSFLKSCSWLPCLSMLTLTSESMSNTICLRSWMFACAACFHITQNATSSPILQSGSQKITILNLPYKPMHKNFTNIRQSFLDLWCRQLTVGCIFNFSFNAQWTKG